MADVGKKAPPSIAERFGWVTDQGFRLLLALEVLDPAKDADQDATRARIGEATAKLLGLNPGALRAIREAWVEEPSVHAGRSDEELAGHYDRASERATREHAAGVRRLDL